MRRFCGLLNLLRRQPKTDCSRNTNQIFRKNRLIDLFDKILSEENGKWEKVEENKRILGRSFEKRGQTHSLRFLS